MFILANKAPAPAHPDLIDSKVVAWSRQKLGPVEPPARSMGDRMVADLLLEDRE